MQRPYIDTSGKVDNCQIGVFAALASSRGRALVDRKLHLPASPVWGMLVQAVGLAVERHGRAGIGGSWTPRELRHSFVSLMSDSGAPEKLIADLVGDANTTTTRTIYRRQLQPAMTAPNGS